MKYRTTLVAGGLRIAAQRGYLKSTQSFFMPTCRWTSAWLSMKGKSTFYSRTWVTDLLIIFICVAATQLGVCVCVCVFDVDESSILVWSIQSILYKYLQGERGLAACVGLLSGQDKCCVCLHLSPRDSWHFIWSIILASCGYVLLLLSHSGPFLNQPLALLTFKTKKALIWPQTKLLRTNSFCQ